MAIPTLTLCIPTMDRWSFLSVNLPKYLNNPFINEIVISDENGNDVKKIQETFKDAKIKCFVNDSRLGGFANKRAAVSHASNIWVCLMDSDNFAPVAYFEAWARNFDPSNSSIVYCPSATTPQPNHPGFDWKYLIGTRIDKLNYSTIWANIYHKSNNINAGNYIFSRDLFMKSDDIYNLKDKCKCVDVQYQNYLLIKNGAILSTIDGMIYDHIVHGGSYFINEEKHTDTKFFDRMWMNT